MTNISLFKTAKSDKPDRALPIEEFIKGVVEGKWDAAVLKVRSKLNTPSFKVAKSNLPAVTISGLFKTRAGNIDLPKKLISHSGFICIDIDKADNPKLVVGTILDTSAYAQFASCSGEGIKLIYKCKAVKTAEEHRRIYDAAIKRLADKAVSLKADPVVKSIMSLQYVSYDPEAYVNTKTKLIINPLPPIKRRSAKHNKDTISELAKLNEYIDALGSKDITQDYEDWLNIMLGLAYTFGENGRMVAHRLSKAYSKYNKGEVDEKYDSCLGSSASQPRTVATVYDLIIKALPKVVVKKLKEKFNTTHTVGVAEELVDEKDRKELLGLVKYKLFLFKKSKPHPDDTDHFIDLTPTELNLNAFADLLETQGFYKHEKGYVRILANIVEEVTLNEILRILTNIIMIDGDYTFTYNGTEYNFSWEVLTHVWRKIKALSTTYSQIASTVPPWAPNLLKDTDKDSYIPYSNGVLHVSGKTCELIPYDKVHAQIWKDRIIPRDYKRNKASGMFEHFFTNVMGRGTTNKIRKLSTNYKSALWSYGYMLQGFKQQSKARAWILYDMQHGNNGRSGKTIIGQAVGKIRSVATIDGKRLDLNNPFAFQGVQPWNDIVFIDDPKKELSLIPLFNMISGNITIERKGLQPIESSVKFMIATNWVLETGGESEIGRQFATVLDNFYIRYSKAHNNTATPLVDLHGKEFFTGWGITDWNQFDTFSMEALRYYFNNPAPTNAIDNAVRVTHFSQVNEEELFFDLSRLLKTNVIKLKEGYAVNQTILIDKVIESQGITQGRIKAARVVKEFLRAIGVPMPIVISGTQQGSHYINLWKIPEIKDLVFGKDDKLLPPWRRF